MLLSVTEDPGTSLRDIEKNTGVPKSTAHKILHNEKYFAYKYQQRQTLHDGDNARRQEFCGWYTRKFEEDERFPSQILWSDKTKFTNNGIFNAQNLRIWSTENKHVFKPVRNQRQFGFNVWCGILGSRLVRPIIYEETLTSDVYLNLLQNDIEDYLDELPLQTTQNCWFQQDGSPAHNSRAVINYLNNKFDHKWIGTRGPVAWPARSPDLTPLDFCLWGYIKDKVYLLQYQNINELRENVILEFDHVPARLLKYV